MLSHPARHIGRDPCVQRLISTTEDIEVIHFFLVMLPTLYTRPEPGCGGLMDVKEDPPSDEGHQTPESWKAGFNGA